MFILNSESLFTEATRGLLYNNSDQHFSQSGSKTAQLVWCKAVFVYEL